MLLFAEQNFEKIPKMGKKLINLKNPQKWGKTQKFEKILKNGKKLKNPQKCDSYISGVQKKFLYQ